MGIMGILCIIVYYILWVKKSSDDTYRRNWNRSQSINPFTYTDEKGRMRLKSDNRIVYDYKGPDGHTYIRAKNGDFLFDETVEKAKLDAAQNPQEMIGYTTDQLAGYTIKKYARQNKNGEIKYYTIINFRDADLIVNLDTMRIERPTNTQLRFELMCKERGLLNYTEEGFRDMIRDFNLKDEIDRRGIIGECNGARNENGCWITRNREPIGHWSYFDQKGIDYKGNKDRRWIK